jgi:hypothetical protein
MTTPATSGPVIISGETSQALLCQISVALNQLGLWYTMDGRFAAAATTLGDIAAEWTSNPTQAQIDLNTLTGQMNALISGYPMDSNLANAMNAVQALAGTFSGTNIYQ